MYKPELEDVEVDLEDGVIEQLIEDFDIMFPHKHSAVPLHMLTAIPSEDYRQMKIKVMLVSAIKKGLNSLKEDDCGA